MYPSNTRILVVDDSATSRQLVCSELTSMGFTNVIEAADGREGLAKAVRAHEAGIPIKIIISDWNMPHMTGIEFLQKVRNSNDITTTVFILLTSESEMSQVTLAITAGADNYMVKPLQPGVLPKKLEAVWKRNSTKKAA